MSKFKVLVPLDSTEKSMHSINWLKKFFNKEDLEITLINVIELLYTGEMFVENVLEIAENESKQVLEKAAKELEGYKVNKISTKGYISDVILKEAKNGKYDMIVMTKSSIKGISRIVGSETNKVVHHSDVTTIIVPE